VALSGHEEVDEELSAEGFGTVRYPAVSAPRGVFTEPINHIALGIYPA
jgi:hypothetical protein